MEFFQVTATTFLTSFERAEACGNSTYHSGSNTIRSMTQALCDGSSTAIVANGPNLIKNAPINATAGGDISEYDNAHLTDASRGSPNVYDTTPANVTSARNMTESARLFGECLGSESDSQCSDNSSPMAIDAATTENNLGDGDSRTSDGYFSSDSGSLEYCDPYVAPTNVSSAVHMPGHTRAH